MSPEIAPFVSAISVMLAAYGFFYNAYKARIEEGQDVGSPKPDHDDWKAQVAIVEKARSAARLLAVIPVLIWILFLPKVEDQLDAGRDVDFALDRYSTLDVLFVVLATAWLAIAIALGLQARGLTKKRKELQEAEPARPA